MNFNRPIFLAAMAKNNASPIDVPAVVGKILAFYVGDKTTKVRESRSLSCTLLSFDGGHRPYSLELVYRDANTHSVAPHPLLSELADVSTACRESGVYLRQFVTKAAGELPKAWDTPPPFSYVHHNTTSDKIVLLNDFIGWAKLYLYEDGNHCLCSSNPAPIVLALGRIPEDNLSYWDQYMTWGFAVNDETFFKGIKCVAPGSRLVLGNGRAVMKNTHSAGRLYSVRNDLPLIPSEDACRRIIFNSRQLATDFGSLGLSGGRDSRAVAALAITEGLKLDFHTAAPPQGEVEIAKLLVAASRRAMNWREILAETAKTPEGCMLERASLAFFKTEGDSWPSSTKKSTVALRSNRVARRLNLSGGAGEIARGHFYERQHLVQPRRRLSDYLAYLGRANNLLTEEAKSNTLSVMSGVLLEGYGYGLDDLALLDYFFVRSRMRRAYPLSANSVYPLLNPHVFIDAFSRSPEEKLEAATVVGLTAKLMPEWRHVPYLHQVEISLPMEKRSKTALVPYHWETMDYNEFSEKLVYAGAGNHCLKHDAIERIRLTRRGDKHAPLTQNTLERMLWRYGFSTYKHRLLDVLHSASGHDSHAVADECVFESKREKY